MRPTQTASTFTMHIPLAAHQVAQKFRAHQVNTAKGKQVYLNTLAVYVTHTYLEILGINTDLASSVSWDPIAQSLLDTAALHIRDQGQIECRPVLPHSDSCYVPSDVWADRLGYISVQLDTQLQQATLVGFLAKASVEQVSLSGFAQLDTIFDCLEFDYAGESGHSPSKQISLDSSLATFLQKSSRELVQCQQWFDQVFKAGWIAIEDFSHPISVQTEPTFRGVLDADATWTPPTPPTNGMMGAKLLEKAGQRMALCIGLSQNPREKDEVNISVELYPINGDGVLPENTTLSVLDATGKVVIESHPVCDVAYKFIGESGEQFSVQVSLGQEEFGFLETFLI